MSLRVSQLRSSGYGRSRRYGRSSYGRSSRYGRSYRRSSLSKTRRYGRKRRRSSKIVSMYSPKKACFVAMKSGMKRAYYKLARGVVKNAWRGKHGSLARMPKDQYKAQVKKFASMLLDHDVVSKMRAAKSHDYYAHVDCWLHAGEQGGSTIVGNPYATPGGSQSSSSGGAGPMQGVEQQGENAAGSLISAETGGLISAKTATSIVHAGVGFVAKSLFATVS